MRALVFSALLALAACASSDEERTAPAPAATHAFDGTSWTLAGGAANAPTLEFEGARASGFAGCNRWFATALGEGGALRFDAVATTRRMCAPEAMQVEQSFVRALGETRNARRDGNALVFSNIEDAEVLRFEPRA